MSEENSGAKPETPEGVEVLTETDAQNSGLEEFLNSLRNPPKPERPADAEPAEDVLAAIDAAGVTVLDLVKRIEKYLDDKVNLQNFLEHENQSSGGDVPFLEGTQRLIDSKSGAVLSTGIGNLVAGFELLRRAVTHRVGL